MAKKKGIKITEAQLAKKGVLEFSHTDSYGITYEVKLHEVGLVMNGRVLAEDGRLVFHNERSFDTFEAAKAVYEATYENVMDERVATHKRYAEMAKQEAQPAMSLEDRLREALRRQMAEYRVAA